MGKKKEVITLDQRIEDLKKQQEQVRDFFIELQGAIKLAEQMKSEEDEKTD
jgi:hypothetical protein